jgi:hypothetical protein
VGVIHLPQERLSVRKFKEALRLHSLGLKQRQIAGSRAIAQSTIHEYLKAAPRAGVSLPLPAEWNEQQLESALSRKPRPGAKTRQAAQPDFPSIRRQLQAHRNLTLQLLWDESREAHPEDGYSYSRYVAVAFMLRDHLKAMTHAAIVNVHAT